MSLMRRTVSRRLRDIEVVFCFTTGRRSSAFRGALAYPCRVCSAVDVYLCELEPYALDSTTIDLCLSVFPYFARPRQRDALLDLPASTSPKANCTTFSFAEADLCRSRLDFKLHHQATFFVSKSNMDAVSIRSKQVQIALVTTAAGIIRRRSAKDADLPALPDHHLRALQQVELRSAASGILR
jgi:hypothetical protein